MDRTQLDKIAKYQRKTFRVIQFLKTLMRGFPDKIVFSKNTSKLLKLASFILRNQY